MRRRWARPSSPTSKRLPPDSRSATTSVSSASIAWRNQRGLEIRKSKSECLRKIKTQISKRREFYLRVLQFWFFLDIRALFFWFFPPDHAFVRGAAHPRIDSWPDRPDCAAPQVLRAPSRAAADGARRRRGDPVENAPGRRSWNRCGEELRVPCPGHSGRRCVAGGR